MVRLSGNILFCDSEGNMADDLFPGLNIANSAFLDELEGRQKCLRCGRSRMFYCYSCNIPLSGTEDKIPHVKLPFKIDIIKHPQEVDGKSTSGHAAVIAPDDVQIYTYPIIPDYTDPSKVLLVFPGKDALTMDQYMARCLQADVEVPLEKPAASPIPQHPSSDNLPKSSETDDRPGTEVASAAGDGKCNACTRLHVDTVSVNFEGTQASRRYCRRFERVVFIDSTWFQVRRIYSDDRLKGLQKIQIEERTTKFWRQQKKKPAEYLSTIEAIYYFLCDYHSLFESEPYTGQYDNLLFFFVYMYRKIHKTNHGKKSLNAHQTKDS